ncbi:2-amino-4-hydroxy-6-hydroxymethyldihydropteridine diphosphokinase [Novosphingobium sp.]|uniref:2-amino-4-hydroxy-6- hydroxymethyldihydropteridine diphosphokinase n=1 Tax=Novosphingobium sp. TaxID=1874826 RepID=UPI0025D3153D|nr:2-amino-4-hydroxy-6-hydroxymethyldihydropteridine diphosphokinase [Novosphingobium sp.]MCC6926516.1 2-amino-4-hydroxy-6-hydroxymethyldihydropteridine diphosphokinase [Novosphingobium sp.]
MNHRYLIALGSNRRHPRFGRPEHVLAAALAALEAHGIKVEALGPTIRSAPIGPSLRRYANGALVAASRLEPDELLDELKAIERRFGRRTGGQRWSSRVLDLDIVLWSGGAWSSPGLTVPHAAFRERLFVLTPALPIAGTWRDPLSGRTLRQITARLTRPRPIPSWAPSGEAGP